MKNEDILNALSYLPDDLIEKTAKVRYAYSEGKSAVMARFLKPALAVASVALICGVSVFAMSRLGIGTADEALPELAPSREDASNERPHFDYIFDASENDYEMSASDLPTADQAADDALTEALAPSETSPDMSDSNVVETTVEIESGLPDEVADAITADVYFCESSITLESKNGTVISEINLRRHLDTAGISVGGMTLNYSKKNTAQIDALLTVIENSPIISPSSTTDLEKDPMATLNFYISEGWPSVSDTVHTPVRVAVELLFGGYVRITVDEFYPIYISVSEEALTEFTNGLEYPVTND